MLPTRTVRLLLAALALFAVSGGAVWAQLESGDRGILPLDSSNTLEIGDHSWVAAQVLLPISVRPENGASSSAVMSIISSASMTITATPRETWREAAEGLIDAIAGIWQAPVSRAAEPHG